MISQETVNSDKVRMEYFGPRVGAVTYHGKRRKYRFGNNTIDRYEDVNPEDVELLLRIQGFKVVKAEAFAPQAGSDFIPAPDNEPKVTEFPPGEYEGEIYVEKGEIIKGAEAPVETSEPIQEDLTDIEEAIEPDLPAPIPDTVKEIQAAAGDADIDTLLSWMNMEQSREKPRKTALEAINAALEEHFA